MSWIWPLAVTTTPTVLQYAECLPLSHPEVTDSGCLHSKEKAALGPCQLTGACGARTAGLFHFWVDFWAWETLPPHRVPRLYSNETALPVYSNITCIQEVLVSALGTAGLVAP